MVGTAAEKVDRRSLTDQPTKIHPRAQRGTCDGTLKYALTTSPDAEAGSRERKNASNVDDPGQGSSSGYIWFNMSSKALTLTFDCSQEQMDLEADGDGEEIEQPMVG